MGNSKTLSRAFGSPLKYIQGPGEFDELPSHIKPFGGKTFALIDGFLYESLGKRMRDLCKEESITCEFIAFCGECSEKEIERVTKSCEEAKADVILGIGGGKVLDTIKCVANKLETPFILIPTIASTDSPTSAMSVIYSDEGEHLYCTGHRKGADIVLVDSEIITKAPVRFFVSGIGDALSTWFEAKANEASGHMNEIGKGYRRCLLGMGIAELCYRIIMEYGLVAKLAVEKGLCTEAVENVIEANTLLSGLGFENTGEAAAHGIHSGLTAIPETAQYYHGEKVAFGTICEMVLEDAPVAQLNEVIDFCYKVGLPITLSDLGLEATEKNIRLIAKKAVENHLIHAEPVMITEQVVYNSIAMADTMGTAYKQKVAAGC